MLSDFARGDGLADRPLPAEAEALGDRAAVVVARPEPGADNVQISGLSPRRSLVLPGAAPAPGTTGDFGGASGGATASIAVEVRRLGDVSTDASATVEVTAIRPTPGPETGGETVARIERPVTWLAGQATASLSVELPLGEAGSGPDDGGGRFAVYARVVAAGGVGVNPLDADDARWTTLELRRQIDVAIVASPGDGGEGGGGFSAAGFVRAALGPGEGGDAGIVTRDLAPASVTAEALGDADAVFVTSPDQLAAPGWDALAEFAGAGGLVWVFPSAGDAAGGEGGGGGEGVPTWFTTMRQAMGVTWSLGEPAVVRYDDEAAEASDGIAAARLDSDLRPPEALLLLAADWRDLLGPVRVRRQLDLRVPDDQRWIASAGVDGAGSAFVASAPVGGGRVVLAAVPLDPAWTNLPTKPLFPALVQDGLRGVLGEAARQNQTVTVGEQPELGAAWRGVTSLKRLNAPSTPASPDDAASSPLPVDTLPAAAEPGGADRRVVGPVARPGVYTSAAAAPGAAAGGAALAVNVDPAAGDLEAMGEAELAEWLDALGPWSFAEPDRPAATLATARAATNLGWTLLWVLLSLVLVEMMLARWFSHAATRGSGTGDQGSGRSGRQIVTRVRNRLSKAAGYLIFTACVVAAGGTSAAANPLETLLGLDTVRLSNGSLSLGWRYDVPVWAWVLIVAGAWAAAWFSYRHLLGRRWARYGLAGVRTALIVLIAVLLAGPQVVRRDEIVEPDRLLVMVDRSASMRIADVRAGGASVISRDEAVRAALRDQGEVFGPEQLGKGRETVWFGFGEQAFRVASPLGDPAALGEPEAMATALRQAIEQGQRQAAGRPISGIVLLTDGRSPESTGGALLNRLAQDSIRVFAVPVGSETLPLDLALVRVDPPQTAFINDTVPVTVTVEQAGSPDGSAVDPADVTVRLVDLDTGETLDERSLEGVGLGEPLRLEARPTRVGEPRWRVEVLYKDSAEDSGGSGGDLEGELNLTNNAEEFVVRLIDRPIRVLYVEGYPRWEYRYLKNTLVRERSIDSSVLLLSADRAFAQEGDTPITRLPRDAEEWRRYDVVVVGDVPAEAFSAEQRRQLHDLVAQQGRGLVWIGGPAATPTSYGGTVLADLLPMREPEATGVLPWDRAAVEPTALAGALSVLQLRDHASDGGAGAGGAGWPEDLPPLRWAQDFGGLKPTAEVLATARPVDSAGTASALVTRLRFGAGQSVYVGTDETWRWRYGKGEAYAERFWVQLIRMLGREAAARSDERVRLSVSSRRVPEGATVVVDLDVQDASLLSGTLSSVRVAVRRAGDGADGATLEALELRPEAGEAGEGGGDGATRRYTTPWRPLRAGDFELTVDEPALAGLGLSAGVEVVSPDDELRRPEADRARLTELAAATGGRVVELSNLAELARPGVVPNLSRKVANDVAEPIWDSLAALILIVLLVTVEWVGRKVIRLV